VRLLPSRAIVAATAEPHAATPLVSVQQQTIAPPTVEVPDTPPRTEPRRPLPGVDLIKRYPWVAGGIGLLIVSLLAVLWAGTRPGYDPYGWLVWGKLTVHLKLDTNGAPSWKPLPFLFTAPYSLFGHYALWLWMVTSVAVSLSGFVFAYRIAFYLVDARPERRYAAYIAGLAAALGLLTIRDYTHFIFSSQSDTMIVSLCLAAIDCNLHRRYRWAYWMWMLGSLGRPEVWPFLGLQTVWMWWKLPQTRKMVGFGLLLLPLFWFGIPALTSKSAFTAGNLAQNSPRALKNDKFFGTLHRFTKLQEEALWLAAFLGTAIAFVRRDRTTLMLAGGAILWVLIECAFALHGWPSVPRYLFEPVAVACVIAGVFAGRVVHDLPPMLAGWFSRVSPTRGRPRLATQLGSWGAVIVLAAFTFAMLPGVAQRVRTERKDLTHERARALEFGRLSVVVNKLGASHILSCGQPNIPIGYQSVFAWYMGTKTGIYYVSPGYFKTHPHPLVNFYPLSNGWKVFPSHVTAAARGRCHGLRLVYRS
jgi:hypothetical protein